jgi:hypothetical protein
MKSTSGHVEIDVATIAQRPGATSGNTSKDSYTYGERWRPPDLWSSRNCGSRSVWIRSKIPYSMTVCSDGVVLAPTQPFKEPHERERCERETEEAHGDERRGELLKGTPTICCVLSSSKGASLYRERRRAYPGGGQGEDQVHLGQDSPGRPPSWAPFWPTPKP